MVPFALCPWIARSAYLLRISALIRRIIARRESEGRAPVIAIIRSPICMAIAWSAAGSASETLTESDLVGTTGETLGALRSLAAMGVRIAIDDFGTGYSNLAYLRHLPVHGLKLAGPFVTGVGGHGAGPTHDVDREVVGLLIRMAHALGLTVTAESVETAAQYAHLLRLGCATGQGWLFAPAMAAEEIPPLVGRTL